MIERFEHDHVYQYIGNPNSRPGYWNDEGHMDYALREDVMCKIINVGLRYETMLLIPMSAIMNGEYAILNEYERGNRWQWSWHLEDFEEVK